MGSLDPPPVFNNVIVVTITMIINTLIITFVTIVIIITIVIIVIIIIIVKIVIIIITIIWTSQVPEATSDLENLTLSEPAHQPFFQQADGATHCNRPHSF